MGKQSQQPQICDYEGSNYRTDFWEGKGRNYEDRAERVALHRLLPASGQRLLEIGAGFGRLTNEYAAFQQVVLLDYSFSQLQYAQEHLGRSDQFIYVAADAYKLPFRPGSFDAATMIRVIHHMANVPAVLEQIRRVMAADGTFILEYANKQNFKAIARYILRRQEWSPFDLTPLEFVELNFDFHPDYIKHQLHIAGFASEKRLPVSFFRLALLKDNLPTSMLVTLDGLLQWTGLLYTPSIFVKNKVVGASPDNLHTTSLFVCPESGGELEREGDILTSVETGQRWAIRDGIYDFKAPIDD